MPYILQYAIWQKCFNVLVLFYSGFLGENFSRRGKIVLKKCFVQATGMCTRLRMHVRRLSAVNMLWLKWFKVKIVKDANIVKVATMALPAIINVMSIMQLITCKT